MTTNLLMISLVSLLLSLFAEAERNTLTGLSEVIHRVL